MSTKSRFVRRGIVLFLIVAALIGIREVYLFLEPHGSGITRNAGDATGQMVVAYMKTHDNRWPHSWQDLREPYEQNKETIPWTWPLDKLKDWVVVDWDFDPAKVGTDLTPGNFPRIIKPCNHWVNWDTPQKNPNMIIYDYLTRQPKPTFKSLIRISATTSPS